MVRYNDEWHAVGQDVVSVVTHTKQIRCIFTKCHVLFNSLCSYCKVWAIPNFEVEARFQYLSATVKFQVAATFFVKLVTVLISLCRM